MVVKIASSRTDWINEEIAGYFDHFRRIGQAPGYTEATARSHLERVTPHPQGNYFWKKLRGLALAGKAEFTQNNGPVPQTVDFFGLTLNEKNELCLIVIERSDTPDIPALPGGYVNWGERSLAAMIRETEEEIGYRIQAGSVSAVESPDLYVMRRAGKSSVRRWNDSSTYGMFIRRPVSGQLQFSPSLDEVKSVHLLPLVGLIEGISNGRVAMFADHGVGTVLATAAFIDRMKTTEVQAAINNDEQLSLAWAQLRPLEQTVNKLVARGSENGFVDLVNEKSKSSWSFDQIKQHGRRGPALLRKFYPLSSRQLPTTVVTVSPAFTTSPARHTSQLSLPKAVQTILTRHGLYEGNLTEYRQEHDVYSLLPDGINQVKQTKAWLEKNDLLTKVDTWLVSPTVRTHETAQILNPAAQWIENSEVRERSRGLLHQMSTEDFKQEYPQEFADFRRHPFTNRPPGEGAESLRDAGTRVTSAIAKTVSRLHAERLYIAGHGESILGHWGVAGGFTAEELATSKAARDYRYRFHNGDTLVLDREDPHTGVVYADQRFVRHFHPDMNPEKVFDTGWQRVPYSQSLSQEAQVRAL